MQNRIAASNGKETAMILSDNTDVFVLLLLLEINISDVELKFNKRDCQILG